MCERSDPMEKSAYSPVFTLAHIGINAESPEASMAIVELFTAAFGFPVKQGNSSFFWELSSK